MAARWIRLPACVLLVCCVALGACNFFDDDDDDGCGDRVLPLEGKVKFEVLDMVREMYDFGLPQITLLMETEHRYSSGGYEIEADLHRHADTLVVDISHIHPPCGPAAAWMAPATYRHALDLDPGTYGLVFEYREHRDVYGLVVTDSLIRVEGEEGSFTIPETSLAWRVPPHSFVYECYATDPMQWVCGDFRDSLLAIPSIREFSFPDSGKIPYPENQPGSYFHHSYFLYDTEEDYAAAGDLYRRYVHDVIDENPHAEIALQNWRNIRYTVRLLAD